MKTNPLTALAVAFSLGTLSTQADPIPLTDGTLIEGTFGPPAQVTITTPWGDRIIPFALLPLDVQKLYWSKAAGSAPETAAAGKPAPVAPQLSAAAVPTVAGPAEAAAPKAPVTEEELAALATAVNLETWSEAVAIGSFRDKAGKRGSGGLVVKEKFNAIEENWDSVYSAENPVGAAKNWDAQVAAARAMIERNPQFMQRRWLDLFIKAGEAVQRRDSNEFAGAVREMKRSRLTASTGANPATSANFFPAK